MSQDDTRAAASTSVAAPAIELLDVHRHFGGVHAVDGVTLCIQPGEFFSLLGPSGSGKTTCLRLIAGFDQPDAGHIRLHGQDVTHLPPYRRDVNTVFQDYALFPHMSLLENVAYGLHAKHVPAAQAKERALQALTQVALDGMQDRRPAQLSGGQRQRVALARAIVNRPKVLLLDEPLSALDLRLREQMRVELKKLHRQLGISFVFVTHDQGEAMTMSDRVAVFSQGRVEQVDSPRALYNRPATSFVAEFVGGSNVLRGAAARSLSQGRAEIVSIRPEQIRLRREADTSREAPGQQAEIDRDGMVWVRGVLADVQYHGARSRWEVEWEGRILTAELASGSLGEAGESAEVGESGEAGELAQATNPSATTAWQPGETVWLSWPAQAQVELAL